MIRRTFVASALAVAAIAAAAFAPAASAGTAWSVTLGAPGFAVSAGSPYAYAPAPVYRPYWGGYHPHRHYAPRVVYRPAYPIPYYAPPPVVYRPAPSVYYGPYAPY